MAGEFDWVFICSLVGTIAAIISVLITHSQHKAEKKAIERPKIVELAKNVLNPFIDELGKIAYTHLPRELSSWGGVEYLDDLERKKPGIKKKLGNHNAFSEILKQRIVNIKAMIETPEFVEKSREMIRKYNETAPKGKELDSADPSLINRISYFIIQNRKELGNEDSMADFWRIYGGEILKVREKENIRNAIEEYEKLLREYLENARKLQEELIELREKWVKEFNLLREEIKLDYL
jgi:hypothetical protein